MTRRLVFLLATAALTAATAPTATAADSVAGTYGCMGGDGSGLLPSDASLKLKRSGHYKLQRVNSVVTAPSHGTYSRDGRKLHFAGGVLDGKTGTITKHPAALFTAQIVFRTWLNGAGQESCVQ